MNKIYIWSRNHPDYETRMIAMSLGAMMWMSVDIPLSLI